MSCGILLLLVHLPAGAIAPAPADIASKGRANMDVVHSTNASVRVRDAARELAEQLGRITGAPFRLTPGDGASGLAVGIDGDFPGVSLDRKAHSNRPEDREHYLIRSHEGGVILLGASEAAVEDAVWDFLYRIGHRQFFPGPVWEIVPRRPDLSIAVDVQERPSYLARSIWYGYGTSDYNEAPFGQWKRRNRSPGAFSLNTGHAYAAIFRRNKDEFEAHPEYLGLVRGARTSNKFCVSNAGLRELVVKDALAYFEAKPEADTYSVEPSDGGGWCECPACDTAGSPSDRAVLLANTVASAVSARWPGKRVALYAYHLHSPPPSISVEPNVIVSVATAFTRKKATAPDLLSAWRDRGVRELGVREYYSVNPWDRSLPGRPRSANLQYLKDSIPRFHALGARYLSAESSDNWGPAGLSYYIAARLLWDVREADRIPQLVDDFLKRSFGTAHEPMAEFYSVLSSGERMDLDQTSVRRLYGLLARAKTMSMDPAVRARLHDLTLYVRYVELFGRYQHTLVRRQEAFEQLLTHAYRMRGTMMVHVKPLFTDLPKRDKLVRLPPEEAWDAPESASSWKKAGGFTPEEVEQMLAQGAGETR